MTFMALLYVAGLKYKGLGCTIMKVKQMKWAFVKAKVIS